MKEFKFQLKVAKSRILSVRKEVRSLAISSILLIELLFNHFQAYNKSFYELGVIYLKICYSYFSAFIFYLLVVHFPRERRRVKSFRFLSNNVTEISQESRQLFGALFKKTVEEVLILTNEEIELQCKIIDPNSPIKVFDIFLYNFEFPNYFEYLYYKIQKNKKSYR